MSLAKLKEKYNPLQVVPGKISQAQATSSNATLTSWQDSAPVSRLSIYMKEHGAAAGIRLCQSKGKPHLTFDPGLGCADMKTERWQIANNTIVLLIDATDDLKYLIANGLINLPIANKGGSLMEVDYGS
jgi:hypothetical protein